MTAPKLDLEQEAKLAGNEGAELADEILSSEGDPNVYEDEMARLRINLASIVFRHLRRVQEATRAEDCEKACRAVCYWCQQDHPLSIHKPEYHVTPEGVKAMPEHRCDGWAIRRALLGKGK